MMYILCMNKTHLALSRVQDRPEVDTSYTRLVTDKPKFIKQYKMHCTFIRC